MHEIHGVLSFEGHPTLCQDQPVTESEWLISSQSHPTPPPSVSPTHSESITFRKASTLTLIAALPSNEQKVSEEVHSEDNALSECSTICEIPEEIEHEQEQEQSYATAPTITGPSMDPAKFRTPSTCVPRNKGKGHAISMSPYEGTTSLPHSSRDIPLHLAQANEGWDDLKQSLGDWSIFTKKTKVDTIQQ